LPDYKQGNINLKLADRATLSLLSALEDDKPITQRGLSARIGVALGLTNSLLKRAVHKGLVKVGQAPAKRFAYYVTPKGFSEKGRLVADFLSSSLDFFRQARDEYAAIYDEIKLQGHSRVVLFGAGELAEIATLSAQNSQVEVLAMIHPGSNQAQFSGLPVVNNMNAMLELAVDAVVITNAEAPQEAYELLAKHFEDAQIHTAPLLHVSRRAHKRSKL